MYSIWQWCLNSHPINLNELNIVEPCWIYWNYQTLSCRDWRISSVSDSQWLLWQASGWYLRCDLWHALQCWSWYLCFLTMILQPVRHPQDPQLIWSYKLLVDEWLLWNQRVKQIAANRLDTREKGSLIRRTSRTTSDEFRTFSGDETIGWLVMLHIYLFGRRWIDVSCFPIFAMGLVKVSGCWEVGCWSELTAGVSWRVTLPDGDMHVPVTG